VLLTYNIALQGANTRSAAPRRGGRPESNHDHSASAFGSSSNDTELARRLDALRSALSVDPVH